MCTVGCVLCDLGCLLCTVCVQNKQKVKTKTGFISFTFKTLTSRKSSKLIVVFLLQNQDNGLGERVPAGGPPHWRQDAPLGGGDE